MSILLTGLSHNTAPVELREQCFLNGDGISYALNRLTTDSWSITETVIVSTCNRLEIYAVADNADQAEGDLVRFMCNHYGLDIETVYAHTYHLRDDDAIDHLYEVVCGLDSMVLGETQILGQVSDAYKVALAQNSVGAVLDRLFNSALHTGKRCRTETDIANETVSISHAAVFKVIRQFDDISNVHALVVGAGEMAKLAADALRSHELSNITIINRTCQRAQELAEHADARVSMWHELPELLTQVDVVISATGAPHLVLEYPTMKALNKRRTHPLVLVDIALPRDIDPQIGELDNVTLFDIDDLQRVVDANLAKREACVPQVRAIISEEKRKYTAWLMTRAIVPTITDLRSKVESVVHDELQDTLHQLSHLDDHDRKIIQRFAHRVVNKVLHEPTVNLRERAVQGDAMNYSQVVRELFALAGRDIDD